MSLRFLAQLVCAVFLCTAFARADEHGAETPATDSTQAKNASDNGTAPAEGNTLKVTTENILSIVSIVLPHNALKNSESLHDWPFLAFAVPAWGYNLKLQQDYGKALSLKGLAAGDVNFAGFGIKLDASVELIHLLELGVQTSLGTAINYGEASTFMGVYNPEKRDYEQDLVFTEYTYGVTYHSALTIPLLAFLPKSDWTKIILKGSAELTYSAYTGADDKQVWKAGNENSVNGFKYRYGGTLIYMLPFSRVPMAMVSANASGFKHEYDFDERYKDYNPGFVKVSITPMASVKISDKWNGMLMVNISRDRVYENQPYPSTEEVLQKQVDSEWELKAVMFIASRKF